MGFAAKVVPQTDYDPAVLTRTTLTLDNGVVAEIASFANLCDDREHVAVIYPQKNPDQIPLVRLHSECLTGDTLGSAHCDCGDQLREAQKKLSEEGGILLYLRQEGRGIGLYQKLRAYRAQQELGLDTFAANRHIGFADDPRNFRIAAQMLQALGAAHVRLLTNNPDKTDALRKHGIAVDEIIPTGRFEKEANARYLLTKRKRGHTV